MNYCVGNDLNDELLLLDMVNEILFADQICMSEPCALVCGNVKTILAN